MRLAALRAVRSLRRHKGRSVAMISALAAAVMGVATASLTSVQLNASLERARVTSVRPDLELVTAWTSDRIASVFRHQPNVSAVQARGYEPAVWKLSRRYERLDLIGIPDFRHLILGRIGIVKGALPKPGQILMEAFTPPSEAVGVGSRIVIITGRGVRTFTVSGLSRSPGLPSPDLSGRETAYVRLDDLSRIAGSGGTNDFLIKLVDESRRLRTTQRLGHTLDRNGIPIFRSQVGPDESASHVIDSLAGGIWAATIGVMVLSLLVVVGGMNKFVSDERADLVSMRLMGAGSAAVIKSYAVLTLVCGCAGVLLGVLLGSLSADLLVRYVASQFTLDTGRLSVPGTAIGVSVATGILLSAVASVLALAWTARDSLNDAIDGHDSDPVGARDWIPVGIWRALRRAPVKVLLGARELALRKKTAVPAICALTLSGLTFLTTASASKSFDAATARMFSSYRADLYVSLARPTSYDAVRRVLRSVPGVRRIEPLAQLTVTTRWGPAEVTGIATGSRLYLPRLRAGGRPGPGDRGAAVISADAARRSGLHIGDSIAFHDDFHRVSLRIVGIGDDLNGIRVGAGSIGTIVAPIQQVSAFRRLPPSSVDEVMIQSAAHPHPEVDALNRKVAVALAANGYQADVTTTTDQLDATRRELRVVYQLLYGIAGILALAGGSGISSMLSVKVREQGCDRAIMQAMGATSRSLAGVIWVEGLALGLLAWIVTVAIGIPIAFAAVTLLARQLILAPFSLSVEGLLLALPLLLIIGVMGSVVPGMAAARTQAEYALP